VHPTISFLEDGRSAFGVDQFSFGTTAALSSAISWLSKAVKSANGSSCRDNCSSSSLSTSSINKLCGFLCQNTLTRHLPSRNNNSVRLEKSEKLIRKRLNDPCPGRQMVVFCVPG
jgi:hypothetical protein